MPASAAWPQSYTGAFTQIIRTVCGMSKPPITVSSLDLERLETLLESPAGASFPGRSQLQAELDRAEIVEPADMPPHVVTMHSTVKFSIHETGKDFCLTLVYPRDAGNTENAISIFAPVGSALLGLSVGDELAWPVPGGGSMTVRVAQVTYQPERAGDLHR
mgnify:FL=1